ncbi:MAG: Clp protease N-terminal domain-containing protein [bacterium]
MTIKLTPRAGTIIQQLAIEARVSGAPVGPEHLLLALVNDPVGVAGRVLHRRGLKAYVVSDLESVITDVQPQVAYDSQHATMTPLGRAILEQAEAEARRLGSDAMGTEHLLLALVKGEDGVAGQILRRRRLQVTDVESDIRQLPSESTPRDIGVTIKLTPGTHGIVDEAEAEAWRLGSDVMGTEHLLLALVKDEDGLAGQILRRRLQVTDVESDIRQLPSESRPRETGATIKLTPRTQATLEQAETEARRLGSDVMGTEHVLLALVNDEEGGAGQILRRRGLHITDVEGDINEAIAPRESAAFPGHPHPWGSRVEHDEDGNAVINADGSLRQYLIDREGRPVLDAQGRRMRSKLDPNGDVLLDEKGEPRIEPIN